MVSRVWQCFLLPLFSRVFQTCIVFFFGLLKLCVLCDVMCFLLPLFSRVFHGTVVIPKNWLTFGVSWACSSSVFLHF